MPYDYPAAATAPTVYRTQVYLGSDLWVRVSETVHCADLTDVTLADEDTNSILTDNASRAIQGNVVMQVTQTGGQIWCHLMTNASGITLRSI